MYRASNGYITIECLTQDMWEALARAMNRQDLLRDPRFLDLANRLENAEELDREIHAWMQHRTVEEVMPILEQYSIPSGPVFDTPTLVKDPQFQANDTVLSVEYPGLGALPLLAPPIRLTGEGNPQRGRPPRLGEHTGEVLSEWLGLGPGDMEALRAAGAF